MAEIKKFSELTPDEQTEFKKALKEYRVYQDEIKDLKESQKEQVKDLASKLTGWKTKDVRKWFVYITKSVRPEYLREDADGLEEILENG